MCGMETFFSSIIMYWLLLPPSIIDFSVMTHYSDSRLKDNGSHFFLDWQTGWNVWSNRFKSVFSRTRKRGKADQTLCLVHWIFWDQFWQDTALTSCEIVRYLTLWFVGILSEENNNTKEGRSKIPDIQLFSCFKNTWVFSTWKCRHLEWWN